MMDAQRAKTIMSVFLEDKERAEALHFYCEAEARQHIVSMRKAVAAGMQFNAIASEGKANALETFTAMLKNRVKT